MSEAVSGKCQTHWYIHSQHERSQRKITLLLLSYENLNYNGWDSIGVCVCLTAVIYNSYHSIILY